MTLRTVERWTPLNSNSHFTEEDVRDMWHEWEELFATCCHDQDFYLYRFATASSETMQ